MVVMVVIVIGGWCLVGGDGCWWLVLMMVMVVGVWCLVVGEA